MRYFSRCARGRTQTLRPLYQTNSMPQFPYLVSDLLYDIVETVNCKFSRILTDSIILTATSRVALLNLQNGLSERASDVKSGIGGHLAHFFRQNPSPPCRARLMENRAPRHRRLFFCPLVLVAPRKIQKSSNINL